MLRASRSRRSSVRFAPSPRALTRAHALHLFSSRLPLAHALPTVQALGAGFVKILLKESLSSAQEQSTTTKLLAVVNGKPAPGTKISYAFGKPKDSTAASPLVLMVGLEDRVAPAGVGTDAGFKPKLRHRVELLSAVATVQMQKDSRTVLAAHCVGHAYDPSTGFWRVPVMV